MDNPNIKTHEFRSFCADCGFASSNANGQIGCKVGRLDKFKELGKTNHLDSGFYEITSICNMLRPTEWFEQLEDENNAKSVARKEIQPKVSLVVLAHNTPEHTLLKSLDNYLQQTIRWDKVIVVTFCKSYSNDSSAVRRMLERSGDKYELMNVLDKDELGHLMDSAFRKCTGHYVTFCDGNDILQPHNYLNILDNKINDELKQILMIEGFGGIGAVHGLTVQSSLYKLLAGNVVEPIQKKIRDLAAEQKNEHMILQYGDLV